MKLLTSSLITAAIVSLLWYLGGSPRSKQVNARSANGYDFVVQEKGADPFPASTFFRSNNIEHRFVVMRGKVELTSFALPIESDPVIKIECTVDPVALSKNVYLVKWTLDDSKTVHCSFNPYRKVEWSVE